MEKKKPTIFRDSKSTIKLQHMRMEKLEREKNEECASHHNNWGFQLMSDTKLQTKRTLEKQVQNKNYPLPYHSV